MDKEKKELIYDFIILIIDVIILVLLIYLTFFQKDYNLLRYVVLILAIINFLLTSLSYYKNKKQGETLKENRSQKILLVQIICNALIFIGSILTFFIS